MMTITRTACTPRTLRNLGLAMMVATGAFWTVMLNNPPKTEAAPQIMTLSPMTLPVAGNLPTGVYDAI